MSFKIKYIYSVVNTNQYLLCNVDIKGLLEVYFETPHIPEMKLLPVFEFSLECHLFAKFQKLFTFRHMFDGKVRLFIPALLETN